MHFCDLQKEIMDHDNLLPHHKNKFHILAICSSMKHYIIDYMDVPLHNLFSVHNDISTALDHHIYIFLYIDHKEFRFIITE